MCAGCRAAGSAIRARYRRELIQRVHLYAAMPADDPAGRHAALVAGIKAAQQGVAGWSLRSRRGGFLGLGDEVAAGASLLAANVEER
jgi:hypothetical protein